MNFRGFHDRRHALDAGVMAGLVLLAMLPLFVGRYLPFFDYPAHLSIPAALRHRMDPATDVERLWQLDLRLVPNAFHYAFTWATSYIVSIENASRVFVALFCVAALPVAGALALRELGRDFRLAILLVPVCWNECLWFGFIGFCAALPMSLLVLVLLDRELRLPSLPLRLGLAAFVALLAFTHFFVLALTLGLAIVVLLNRVREVGIVRALRAALPLLAGPIAMASWFLAALRGGPRAASGAVGHLWSARPAGSEYARLLHRWFIDGYTNRVDDGLSILLVLALAVLLARRPPTSGGVTASAATRRLPLLLAGCLAVAYLALPFEIRAPFHWWAMNVRVLPLLFVWLVIGVAPGPLDDRARAVLGIVAAASAAFFIFIALDIGLVFNGPSEAGGLAQVLQALPKGARVLGLYTDYRQRPRYAYYPHTYAAMYAVVQGGGLAAPFVPIPQSWTNPKQVPEFPIAGDAAFFRFETHARPFSHFLVRTCEGQGCVPDPLAGAVTVKLLAESARWRVYGCASLGCSQLRNNVK
jgi:hypothetical protein